MTMHHISTLTASTTTSILTFSSIPQTYSDLQVRVWGKGTFNNGGSGLSVVFAFAGGTPVYRRRLSGNGSSILANTYASSFGSAGTVPDVNAAAEIFGANIFDLLDYTSATKGKTLKYTGGFDRNGSGEVSLGSSSATGGAVGNLSLTTDGNWAAGTRIDLYGITTNPVATGA